MGLNFLSSQCEWGQKMTWSIFLMDSSEEQTSAPTSAMAPESLISDTQWSAWCCSITDNLLNLRVLSNLSLSAHFINFYSVCKMFYTGIFQKEPPEDNILEVTPLQFVHEYGLILFDPIKYSVPYLCFLYCSCNWSQAHCYVVSWILPDPFLHIGTLATSKFPGSLPSLSKLSTISVKGFSISLATSFNIWDVIHLGWMPRQLLTHWCWEVVLCGGRAPHKICYITSGQEVPGDEISGEISHSWSGKTC